MALKVYGDRLSQPCRAVFIFCKLNGIDFEEVHIRISKRQHLSPEYKEVNPMMKLPTIVDGKFMLSDSHAILRYLACSFPGIADHWYPADLQKRAKVDSVLDWHHSNVRVGPAGYVFNLVSAPALGVPSNPQVIAEAKKDLIAYLAKVDSVWLQEKGRFLLGSDQPSIADLSVVCEIMQLELLDEKDRDRILGPYKRVLKWIDDTKISMQPHIQEVHSIIYDIKEKLHAVVNSITQPSRKSGVHSKM